MFQVVLYMLVNNIGFALFNGHGSYIRRSHLGHCLSAFTLNVFVFDQQ